MKQFTFHTAGQIIFGAGASARVGEIAIAKLGKRIVFVTDPGLLIAGIVAPALSALADAGVQVQLYSNVVADPPDSVVEAAVAVARDFAADGVIGMGGGSSMDVAKLTESEVRQVTAGPWPAPLTPRSITSVDMLLRELQETRKRGFSVDDGQTREGMYCFGTAVRDSSNLAIAGVAVSLLATAADMKTAKLAGKSIQIIARQLSRRLGAGISEQ